MLSYRKTIIVRLIICTVSLVLFWVMISTLKKFFIKGPEFSQKSGFYEAAFELNMSTLPGTHIYYTTDGSETNQNSKEYKGGLWIEDATNNDNHYSTIKDEPTDYVPEYLVDKATVIKAIAVWGKFSSNVSTAIYFVGFDKKSGYDNVQIMSMIVDPYDFFSDEYGIYVRGTMAGEVIEGVEYDPSTYPANYNIKSKEMRRKAHVILWNSDRELETEEDIAVAIHGSWSRSLGQKSFSFFENVEYGKDWYGLDEYMLRTSGYTDSNQTMFRDVLNQKLVSNRDVATQSATPCILFINGEYWGIYNLQQRYSKAYFSNQYGIDKDNIIFIKNNEVSLGRDTDIKYYYELIDFAENNDLSISENYNKIESMMDVQSFIDYFCFECYISNLDWPDNNYSCFRSRKIMHDSPYEDGRWRWAIFDTDDSVCINISSEMGKPNTNPFTSEAHWCGNPMETSLMKALVKNKSFCNDFSKTFVEMANENFDYDTVQSLLNELSAIYCKPMVNTQNRFYTMDYTEETFDYYVRIVDFFYKDRANYVIPYMEQLYGKADK